MKNTSKSVLIRNGHIWSASDDCTGDIFVSNGKILAIGGDLKDKFTADEVIDASGMYVFPGGVDVHTHMELPFMGTYSADNFETGTLAGLYGGTTSIVDFAIQSKGSPLKDCIAAWHDKSDGKAVADYGFHCAVTDYNPSVQKEISELINQGITSFKLFMAYKGALMVDDRQILGFLVEVKKHGGLVSFHAENGDLIDFLVDKFKKEGKLSPKYHALAHAPEAEIEAAGRVMDLAQYMNSSIYIVHTTCRGVLERVERNLQRDQKVLIETCMQYLLLDDSCYEKPGFEGSKYVMSPPIRKKDDQGALWKGIQTGLIQTIATDHCPFNFKGQKEMGKDDFSKIPNGAPGIENRLELGFSEGVVKKRITMNKFVEVMCSNPARIFGLTEKGSINVGKDADVVIFDPNKKHTISAKTHHHNVDNSIYEGWEVTGKVMTVLSNGRVVIRDGKAADIEKGQGRFIKRKQFNPVF